MLQFMQQVLLGIIVTVASGVVILLIEYHTGWFAERLNRPNLHDLVVAFVDRCKPVLRKAGRFLRFVVGGLALALLVGFSLILLALLPSLSPGMGYALWLGIAMFAGVFAIMLGRPNLDTIGLILLVYVLIVAVYVAPSGGLQEGALTSSGLADQTLSNLPAIQWSDPRVSTLAVIDMVLLLIVCLVMVIRSQTESRLEKLQAELDLLKAPKGIREMLADKEADWLRSVQTQWWDLEQRVRKASPMAADCLDHAVPVAFKGYALTLGCRTEKAVLDIMQNRPNAKGRLELPPYQKAIEAALQSILDNQRAVVTCIVIKPDQYAESLGFLPPRPEGR